MLPPGIDDLHCGASGATRHTATRSAQDAVLGRITQSLAGRARTRARVPWQSTPVIRGAVGRPADTAARTACGLSGCGVGLGLAETQFHQPPEPLQSGHASWI